MATAQVKQMFAKVPVPVLVIGRSNTPQWPAEIFDHNPKIARDVRLRKVQVLRNGPGMRPYIVGKTDARWVWRMGTVKTPGEMFLTATERAFAEPYRGAVLIEPHTKVADGNKAWIWERWQEVVDRSGVRFVQVGPHETKWLRGVEQVPTTFRLAAAVLSVAKAYVGPEGALHHAAAAFGVPAIVLWSEFISPDVTGYASQRNIRHAGAPCGSRVPCAGCKASMRAITVDEVLKNMEGL